MLAATDSEMLVGLNSFIANCILTERRSRYQALLATQKGRKKWLLKLDHFQSELNTDFAMTLEPNYESRTIITLLDCSDHTKAICWSTLRGAEVGLVGNIVELIDYAWGFGCGSIISSLDSKRSFWLYMGEEREAQFAFKGGES